MLLWRFISFWLFPLASLLIMGGLLWAGPPISVGRWLLYPVAGVLLWSFLEYVLHRFVFHWVPQNATWKEFMFRLHLRHHHNPRDPRDILVRPIFSLPISALLFSGLWLTFGLAAAALVQIGVWIGFVYYELVHYRIHISKVSDGLLQAQRRGHFYHHFVNGHRRYGVTSPIWDFVFRTYATPPRPNEQQT